MRNLPPGELDPRDAAAVEALRACAAIEPPSSFATARAAHDLEAALDGEVRRTARWTPARVVAVASLAACVGAVVAIGTIGVPGGVGGGGLDGPGLVGAVGGVGVGASGAETDGAAGAGIGVASTTAASPAPAISSRVPAAAAAPSPAAAATPSPSGSAAVRSPAASPDVVALDVDAEPLRVPREIAPERRGVRGWRRDAERLLDAGDGTGAARVLVAALARDESAAADLALVSRRFPAALDAIDDELARLRGAEAMRLRCEQRLLRARDRRALDACRAFGQQHPEHPGARTLSYAAGRVAEDDLGDLGAAEEEYSRALLLSPFAGLPATDVLLARARVRAALGDLDEARADLRLYLHHEPLAERDAPVRRLATQLGMELGVLGAEPAPAEAGGPFDSDGGGPPTP